VGFVGLYVSGAEDVLIKTIKQLRIFDLINLLLQLIYI
jgi:hypothetical protein